MGNNKSPQWLNLDSRRRKLMPSTSPLMSMTSREMARLMLSSLVTSSEPATLTQPSRQSPRLEAPPRRDRRCCPRTRSSPSTRPPRTARTREDSKSLMKELCDPADDEGFMPFIPFLERMCAAEKKTSVPRDTRVKLTSSYFSSDRGHVDNVTS